MAVPGFHCTRCGTRLGYDPYSRNAFGWCQACEMAARPYPPSPPPAPAPWRVPYPSPLPPGWHPPQYIC